MTLERISKAMKVSPAKLRAAGMTDEWIALVIEKKRDVLNILSLAAFACPSPERAGAAFLTMLHAYDRKILGTTPAMLSKALQISIAKVPAVLFETRKMLRDLQILQ